VQQRSGGSWSDPHQASALCQQGFCACLGSSRCGSSVDRVHSCAAELLHRIPRLSGDPRLARSRVWMLAFRVAE